MATNIDSALAASKEHQNKRKKPSRVEVAFTKDFLKRIKRGEFESLEDLDNGALETVMWEAEGAGAGVWHEDPDDPRTRDEHAAIWGVYHGARSIVERRQADRGNDMRAQHRRLDGIAGFASQARALCENLAKPGFRPDLMTPEVEPPLTGEAVKSADFNYWDLSRIADESSLYRSRFADEARRIDEAVTRIDALVESKALDTALDDLRARRGYLARRIDAETATETVVRAEMERRKGLAEERRQAEKDLLDTVEQLKLRVVELEGNAEQTS